MLLAIETSTAGYQVALGLDRKPIFISSRDSGNPQSADLADLVAHALDSVKAPAGELTAAALNIGPGGLTSVRVGASFLNALAFSIGIKIYPFNFFEIIAEQSRAVTELPVICAVPASNNHAYVGLLEQGNIKLLRYGLLPAVLNEVSQNLTEIAVVGKIRGQLSSLLDGIKITDTGIEKPDVGVLFELGCRAAENGVEAVDQASPLNDQSEIFYAQA